MNATRTAAPSPEEEFLTKEEVARRLKKTARTIEIWSSRGYIPKLKVGASVLYNWNKVQEHLLANFTVIGRPPRKKPAASKVSDASAQ